MIACSFGYDGRAEVEDKDIDLKNPDAKGEHKWDKFVGVYLIEAETSTNCNEFLKAWNHRVHIWIKYYVSERLIGVGKRPTSLQYFIIFMTSAFWHGFYPNFYIAFSVAVFSSFVHKDIYGMWYLVRAVPRPIRIAVCIFVNQYTVNWAGTIQSALVPEKAFLFMRSTYYIIPIQVVLILLFSRGLGLLKMSKKMERAANE